MKKRLRVRVEKGIFPSERTVSFETGGRNYSLVVDEQDVAADNTLVVHLVGQQGDEALIDLPRETFTSGSRVRIATSELLPA
jgi:hypothetical protein